MKKEKSNPFVSISDLMAGVTAVVMLLLVVSVVRTAIGAAEIEHQKQLNELQKQKAEQERIERKNRGVRQAIKEIKANLAKDEDLSWINVKDTIITLGDKSFKSASACLDKEVELALKKNVAPVLAMNLRKFPNINIQIEGHSDGIPLGRIVSDVYRNCAAFDDNYSLSASRAREARKAVLDGLQGDTSIARRISVAGYGPDRLINTEDPGAAENRRVEIRLVATGDGEL